jgi:alkanesulfonate monooxygenase SsuD/methylene tetrahydromethanopterin reductase-like flavin-dependent oxidoreductase (luciferase family)
VSDKQWIGLHIKCDGQISAFDAMDLAREAEQLGFSGVALNEDVGHDAFAVLGAIAMVTSKITLGSAIANVYCRSALQIAMAAATIDDLTGGRAMLGLSVGHHPWNDQYHGIPIESPLARLREYVAFIKEALTGERFSFEGQFFHGVDAKLGFAPFRTDLPIYIGGDRPKILALSAEIADGSILNVVPSRYISEFAAEHYFSSARKAGRHVQDLELTAIVTCCLNDDRDQALLDARRNFIARLQRNPTKVIELRPVEYRDELSFMAALIAEGKGERAIEEISEEIVADTIAFGSVHDVQSSIDSFFAAGCSRVLVAPYPRTPETIIDTIRALAPRRRVSLVSDERSKPQLRP